MPRAGSGGGYVCDDIASVSAWSSVTWEAEYGHDRDHERLPR